jgi:hypothetical protein
MGCKNSAEVRIDEHTFQNLDNLASGTVVKKHEVRTTVNNHQVTTRVRDIVDGVVVSDKVHYSNGTSESVNPSQPMPFFNPATGKVVIPDENGIFTL